MYVCMYILYDREGKKIKRENERLGNIKYIYI